MLTAGIGLKLSMLDRDRVDWASVAQKVPMFESQIRLPLRRQTAIRCRPARYHTRPIGNLFSSVILRLRVGGFRFSSPSRLVTWGGYRARPFHYTHV